MKVIEILNVEDEKALHDQWLAALATNDRELAKKIANLIDSAYYTNSTKGQGWKLLINTK